MWEAFTITSVYGNAAKVDPDFMAQTTTNIAHNPTGHTTIALGDYNWKPVYANFVDNNHVHDAHSTSFTTTANTTPTHCLASSKPTFTDAKPLPGIPYHHLVAYTMPVAHSFHYAESKTTPQVRPRRCAGFTWKRRDNDDYTPINHHHSIERATQADIPVASSTSNLADRWHNWHSRMELRFQLACEAGLATTTTQVERSKGFNNYYTAFRPTAKGARHRPPQSIATRRLLRCRRGLSEGVRNNTHICCQALNNHDARRIHDLKHDKILPGNDHITTYAEALCSVSHAISANDQATSKRNADTWTNRLREPNTINWRTLTASFRPTSTPAFTAQQMREQWADIWCPIENHSHNYVQAWNNYANDANLQATTNDNHNDVNYSDEQRLPTYDDFHDNLRNTDGSAGWDGWTSHELQTIAEYFPTACAELYDLLCTTTRLASTAYGIQQHHNSDPNTIWIYDQLYRCRTVGITKTEYDSRPISVISGIMRAWHRSLLHLMPPPPEGQWAGRANTSVATATANWLTGNHDSGAELDLTKAYDHCDHHVALRALLHQNVPTNIAHLLAMSWQAERICTVLNQPAIPIAPT